MKKKILLFILIFSSIIAFECCDKINGPYRETVSISEFCRTGIQDFDIHRKVMVEDYTGHLCGNCPPAGIYLNDTLKSLYNHCLIIVSVHADYFATFCPNGLACPGNQPPGAFTTDFNTVAGNDWYNFFGFTSNPKGMVNRINYLNGTHVKSKGEWAGAIANQLATKADAKINVQNSYNSSNRTVAVTIKTKFISALTGNYNLQVLLTEDSIVDWQEWYPPHSPLYVPDYNHRHVLRDALNSSWGENIASGTVSSGDSITKTYNYVLSNNWNADHCSIVAFVYDNHSKEVLQVEEQAVR